MLRGIARQYEGVHSHSLERRRGATDHMVEFDNRLRANGRTIDTLRRAIEAARAGE